jgi:hypothetical protein
MISLPVNDEEFLKSLLSAGPEKIVQRAPRFVPGKAVKVQERIRSFCQEPPAPSSPVRFPAGFGEFGVLIHNVVGPQPGGEGIHPALLRGIFPVGFCGPAVPLIQNISKIHYSALGASRETR